MFDPAGGDDVMVGLARDDEIESVGELTVDAYVADGLASGAYLSELRDASARAEVDCSWWLGIVAPVISWVLRRCSRGGRPLAGRRALSRVRQC